MEPNSKFDEKYVSVEFDDGDSGRIALENIRLLQPDYPVVGTYLAIREHENYIPFKCTLLHLTRTGHSLSEQLSSRSGVARPRINA